MTVVKIAGMPPNPTATVRIMPEQGERDDPRRRRCIVQEIIVEPSQEKTH